MTQRFIVEVNSIEEATKEAVKIWDVLPEDVELSVLDESRVLFGLLGKKVRVEVKPKVRLDLAQAKKILNDIFKMMNVKVNVKIIGSDSTKVLDIDGDDVGLIIGHKGETLKSLEYLVNLMVPYENKVEGIKLNADNYRQRRERYLRKMAFMAAKDCIKKRRPIRLEPMTAWERRIIHLALRENPKVETKSEGEEPTRRVVIWPRKRRRFSA